MPGYSKSTKPRDADAEAKDAYERTVTRLNRLAEQVVSAPRGKSLAGKVCIITGVGSLKGIGLVLFKLVAYRWNHWQNTSDAQPLCFTPEKVCTCKFNRLATSRN